MKSGDSHAGEQYCGGFSVGDSRLVQVMHFSLAVVLAFCGDICEGVSLT